MGESRETDQTGTKSKRSIRQEQAVQKWVDNKLVGTCVFPTGTGKTRIGMLAISRFLAKNPTKKVIIVTPSDPIKQQWIGETVQWKVFENCEVKTMNDVSKHEYSCSLLVIDEIHKTASNSLIKLFENIKYKAILGLTATFERLDNRHELIAKYCPIVDTLTLEEAIKNNWLAEFREYLVLIEPDDIETYNSLNREFYEHFSYFDYDFSLAMACVTSWQTRASVAKQRCNAYNFKDVNKQVLVHAMGFNRTLQARKKYINSHPKKLELTNKILEHRMNKKCITFSATIGMAEKIKYGQVYSGKDSNKKGRIKLKDFIEQEGGILNTVSKVNEGLNCPDISVAIMLGINSSKTTASQRRGRAIRMKPNKCAEIFTLVLKGTVEEKWWAKSNSSNNYITISENDLENVLQGAEYTPKTNKQPNVLFRF